MNILSSKFTSIDRLCFVMSNGNYPYKKFIHGGYFFIPEDLVPDTQTYSDNYNFIIDKKDLSFI